MPGMRAAASARFAPTMAENRGYRRGLRTTHAAPRTSHGDRDSTRRSSAPTIRTAIRRIQRQHVMRQLGQHQS